MPSSASALLLVNPTSIFPAFLGRVLGNLSPSFFPASTYTGCITGYPPITSNSTLYTEPASFHNAYATVLSLNTVSAVILGVSALALSAYPKNALPALSGTSIGNLAPSAVPFSSITLGSAFLYFPPFASNFTPMVLDVPSFQIAYSVCDFVNTVSFVASGTLECLLYPQPIKV